METLTQIHLRNRWLSAAAVITELAPLMDWPTREALANTLDPDARRIPPSPPPELTAPHTPRKKTHHAP